MISEPQNSTTTTTNYTAVFSSFPRWFYETPVHRKTKIQNQIFTSLCSLCPCVACREGRRIIQSTSDFMTNHPHFILFQPSTCNIWTFENKWKVTIPFIRYSSFACKLLKIQRGVSNGSVGKDKSHFRLSLARDCSWDFSPLCIFSTACFQVGQLAKTRVCSLGCVWGDSVLGIVSALVVCNFKRGSCYASLHLQHPDHLYVYTSCIHYTILQHGKHSILSSLCHREPLSVFKGISFSTNPKASSTSWRSLPSWYSSSWSWWSLSSWSFVPSSSVIAQKHPEDHYPPGHLCCKQLKPTQSLSVL